MNTKALTGLGVLGVSIGLGIGIGTGTFDRPVAAGSGADEPIAFPIGGKVTQEPLLIYDVSGFTLIGPLHYRLAVYNSGLCSIAEQGTLNQDGSAAFTYVQPDAVRALASALDKAGAFTLTDNAGAVFDVPLTTVTFFRRPGPLARANTYSYYLGNEGQLEVQGIINEFIDATFPNFPDGGGIDR